MPVYCISCLHLRVYLCEQLFKEGADESGDFVSVQQVKLSLRVSVVVNYSVSIPVKGAATLPWVHLNAFAEGRDARWKWSIENSIYRSKVCVFFWSHLFIWHFSTKSFNRDKVCQAPPPHPLDYSAQCK